MSPISPPAPLESAATPARPGWVRIGGARGELWQRHTGMCEFPVTHVIPDLVAVFGAQALAYMLDFARCTRREQDRIVHFLAERFSRTPDEIRHEIKHAGVPILATDCAVWPE